MSSTSAELSLSLSLLLHLLIIPLIAPSPPRWIHRREDVFAIAWAISRAPSGPNPLTHGSRRRQPRSSLPLGLIPSPFDLTAQINSLKRQGLRQRRANRPCSLASDSRACPLQVSRSKPLPLPFSSIPHLAGKSPSRTETWGGPRRALVLPPGQMSCLGKGQGRLHRHSARLILAAPSSPSKQIV